MDDDWSLGKDCLISVVAPRLNIDLTRADSDVKDEPLDEFGWLCFSNILFS